MEILHIRTKLHSEVVDITDAVEKLVEQSGVEEGICVIYVPHTTAAVTINENADPSVKRDILTTLEKIVPWNWNYTHLEGNAAAHIKSSVIGSDRTILIENGHLVLGTWQGIYFCEFDGPRHREVYVKIIPSEPKRLRSRSGFTLIELTIVIAILSILALFALPKYQNVIREGKVSVCKANLGAVRSAIAISYAKNRHFPVNQNGNLVNYEPSGDYSHVTPLFEIVPVNPYCKDVQYYFGSSTDVKNNYNPCFQTNDHYAYWVVETDSGGSFLKSARVKPYYVNCNELPPGEDPNNW